MKPRICVIALAGIVLLMGGCDPLSGAVNPDEVTAALAVAANEILYSFQAPVEAIVGDRGVGGTQPVDGPDGGTASFQFDTSTGYYEGTLTFNAFTLAIGDGDAYALTGELALRIDFTTDTASLFPIQATYTGVVTITRNGGEAQDFDADLVLSIDWSSDGAATVLVVTSTGTLNGDDVSTEMSVSYDGPLWI